MTNCGSGLSRLLFGHWQSCLSIANKTRSSSGLDVAIHAKFKISNQDIGKGQFGIVRRATCKTTSTRGVLKKVQKSEIDDDEMTPHILDEPLLWILNCALSKNTSTTLQDEAAIHVKLDHAHIVRMYEVLGGSEIQYMFMEACDGGTVEARLPQKAGDDFHEPDVHRVFHQLMSGVCYIHACHIVHRDLKLANLLIKETPGCAPSSWHVKITDFGFAREFTPGNPRLYTVIGTTEYMAPEVLNSNIFSRYSEKCDIWSCGIMLFVMLVGRHPFTGDDDAISDSVALGHLTFDEGDWSRISPNAKTMVLQLCARKPSERLSAQEALQSTLPNLQVF